MSRKTNRAAKGLIPVLGAVFVLAAVAAAPAAAQEFIPPRFEGLEQQQAAVDQMRIDDLDRRRQDELLRPPTPGESEADRGLRGLDAFRDRDLLVLELESTRAGVLRDRALAEAGLPNRRIAPGSTLAIREPAALGLPEPPRGQFYARLGDRLVLVDRMSELVVRVLPQEPLADAP